MCVVPAWRKASQHHGECTLPLWSTAHVSATSRSSATSSDLKHDGVHVCPTRLVRVVERPFARLGS